MALDSGISMCSQCKPSCLENDSISIYLIFGGEFFGAGGWAKYVRELAYFLSNCGCEVKIVCRMGKVLSYNIKTNIPHSLNNRWTKMVSKLEMIVHFPNPLTVALGTIKVIREIRRDKATRKIMHVHDLSSSFFIAYFLWRLLKIPYVVQIHGFPLKEWKIKLMTSSSFLGNFIWSLTKLLHNIAIDLIKKSSAILLVNNNEVKSFYEKCGISPNKIKVVPSAINLHEYKKHLLSKEDAIKSLKLAELEVVTIGYIGGLYLGKNVKTLVKAFDEFVKSYSGVKARLIIIGDGPMRSELEKYVREHGIENVVFFLGYIPDAYRFLNAIDIFVLPSFNEGSPLALIEAMASGKAIIASNIPAIKEMVEDGEEALLFDPYNSKQLKNLILKLYNNPALRKKLEENARRKAEQYDVNVVFTKILQIYKEAFKNNLVHYPQNKLAPSSNYFRN
jgi:glycosyltransferase involved in cell wall biosynthesis